MKGYRKQDTAGFISRNRGRKNNNRLREEVKKEARILKGKHKGFGPTLAHEKLAEKEKLKMSNESVRKLMI